MLVEASTTKVTSEPSQCFVHFGPDLEVTGVPVIRDVKLLTDVAKDSFTKQKKAVSV